MNYTAIDVFAGGGGLTVGLKKAGLNVLSAVEINNHAADTYQANHSEVKLLRKDVRTLSGSDLVIDKLQQIAVFAGCPPCQGFSTLTAKYKKDDPRNDLIMEFIRLVKEIMPLSIMMENVPGMMTKGKQYLEKAIEALKDLGYVINMGILQVADYGVPQQRRRFVLLAGLGFEIPLPLPTHARNGKNGLSPWNTIDTELNSISSEPVDMEFACQNGGPLKFNWHVTRKMSPKNVERMNHIKPGLSRSSIPLHARPKCHTKSDKGFGNTYGRMSWNLPSPTITAGCTTLSKGRFGHPDKNRTISVKEASLLQTFPMDYIFATPYMDHVCQIIGNALPCKFAETIAKQCITYLSIHTKGLNHDKP